MAANVKHSENMVKHLTKAELEARKAAEDAVMPERKAVLKVKSILERMDGLAILDDLDGEMLAVYCSALSRRDSLNALCRALIANMEKEPSAGHRLEMTDRLDGLIGKLQGHEKTLLSYADKLGMTPEARARLARKRAAQETARDPDDDLFGD